MDWSNLVRSFNNSILQLVVTRAKYDIELPYKEPSYEISYGTGFIVDIAKGILVTNASVVGNAITISGRVSKLGQRDLSIKVTGICREKDLALCQIETTDLNFITRDLDKNNITSLNMKFGDSLYVDYTDEVMILGYPNMSEHITCVNGIVSGFKNRNDDDVDGEVEDAIDRLPTCIQITTSNNLNINGGPVINKKGEVIGIITSIHTVKDNGIRTGYAIPSRTLLSIYDNLLREFVVKMPTLSLKWNKTNPNLMKEKTEDGKNYGIYIRGVNMDTCLDRLQTGDVIRQLEYYDVFSGSLESFDVIKRTGDNSIFLSLPGVRTICYFDRYGDFTVYSESPDKTYNKISKRILGFSEIVDMIPIGAVFWMEICRDREWCKIETTHTYSESDRISHLYPKFEPYQYEIFAGICCVDIDQSHINHFENLSYIMKENRYKFKKQVVIVHVFLSSEACKVKALRAGQIIDKVNNISVSSVSDIRNVLKSAKENISISTTNKSYFIISVKEAIQNDKNIFSNFSINNSTHKYILD
jgi:S1-C subfamily serine protease